MKKADLKIQAERLTKTYEKNQSAWAALHLVHAAIKNGGEVPQWAILESLQLAIETTGAVGLDLAEFLDSYYFGGER